jgi:hypothetical protein
MTVEGTIQNGSFVTDSGIRLPEGIRVRLEIVEDDESLDRLPQADSSLEDDDPDAPYDREKELAILRASIAEMNAGGGVPFEQFMEKLAEEIRQVPPTA